MRAEKRRERRLFRTFAFGLALVVYSSGLPASGQQPEMPPQPPNLAAPATVVAPLVTNTVPASGVGEWALSNGPCCCDPVSRVPNFFGSFFARPSRALVVQPAISIETTRTLTFFGLPSDVAGGTGSNEFYPPFSPNGIVGPGGPYPITSSVTGTNVPLPPNISILDENTELTGLIQFNFPGATFVSGTAVLEEPFAVVFEYLATATQTIPGLVALVNLPNPSSGGLVGRNKYFDNGSPLPRDRMFFDYSHVADFNGLGTPFNVNRYVVGAEKTFLGGWGSVEVRVPFAGTANSDQIGGQALDVNNAEFGNVGLLLKGTLFRNANWIVSAGLGVSVPTADDSRLLFGGKSVLEIRNDTWLLQPIVGAAWAPNDRFYVQAGVQFDIDANGNPVYVRSPGGEFSRRGVLTDQTYLHASGAVGYWLYQDDCKFLSAVSLQGELHYSRTFDNQDFVQTGSVVVADLNSKFEVLSATTGVNFVLGQRATLSLGVSFPVDGDRLHDWNLMARLNVRFGN